MIQMLLQKNSSELVQKICKCGLHFLKTCAKKARSYPINQFIQLTRGRCQRRPVRRPQVPVGDGGPGVGEMDDRLVVVALLELGVPELLLCVGHRAERRAEASRLLLPVLEVSPRLAAADVVHEIVDLLLHTDVGGPQLLTRSWVVRGLVDRARARHEPNTPARSSELSSMY